MEPIVEKITQDLLQKLPDQAQSFTPDDLLSAGVPYVVVETIRKNIALSIDTEMNLPETEWLHTKHEHVQHAWQDFVEIAKEHMRVPDNKLTYLLTEAVDQCLELAVKPRQAVPDIIFKTRDMIDVQTVRERVDSIEVNKQLGLVLLRYMQKKEVEEISIDHARQLIKKVDERLIEDYHPLKWAQALKPLFDLAGPEVDTELFKIYFEDKEKPAYARKFDQLDESLNESEFIEALSSADVLDVEGYEDPQPELFVESEEEAEPEKVVEIDETSKEEKIVKSGGEVDSEEPPAEKGHSALVIEDSEEVEDSEETDTKHVDDLEQKTKPAEELPEQPEESEEFEEPKYEDQETPESEVAEDEFSDEEQDQEENIADLFSKIREVDHFESDDDTKPVISLVKDEDDDDEEDREDNITLLSKFMFDESEEEAYESEVDEDDSESEETPTPKEPSSIYEEMNLVQDDGINRQKNSTFDTTEDEEAEDEEELSFKIQSSEKEEEKSEEPHSIEDDQISYALGDEVDDEDDQPMWRSFLERDDLETESGYEYDEEEEPVEVGEFDEDEDDGFIEEPIYDLTSNEGDHEEKINKISGYLDDDKNRFVNKIFKGSEFAYEQALVDIMDFENWKAASMYLESEVFSRNKIDIYDEVAVDFTDRLHSYFLENNTNHED